MSLGEARVLSYHDVLLREADVDILKGPHWLNDQASGHRPAGTPLLLASATRPCCSHIPWA